MEDKLKNLKKDVKSFAKKIVKIAKTDEKVRDLYKGAKIFFSPVVKNPKFMFLGINPGVSPAAKENKLKCEVKSMKKMDYSAEDYRLANEWKYIFGEKDGMLNRMDLLENSFKTNFYYVTTKDMDSLYELLNLLKNKYNLTEESFFKPCEWTKTLISIVNPEFILAEGFAVFDELKRCYPDIMCDSTQWGNNENYKIGYINNEGTSVEVIACSRRHSDIRNASEIAEIIKAECLN